MTGQHKPVAMEPTKTGKKRRDLDSKETTTTKKCWSWSKDQWSCFIQKWVIESSYSEPSTKEQAVEHGFMRRPPLPDTPKSARKEKVCIWKTLSESPLTRGNVIWTKGLVKYYATAFESTDVKPVLTITEKHVMLVTWKNSALVITKILVLHIICFDKRAYFTSDHFYFLNYISPSQLCLFLIFIVVFVISK